MTCPSPLQRAIYADGEMHPEDVAEFERHSANCEDCRRQVAAQRRERDAIRAALRRADAVSAVPPFSPPPTISNLLVWLGWMALAAWGVHLAWAIAAPLEVPLWLRWLSPDALGAGVDLVIGLTVYLATGGGEALDRLAVFAGLLSLAIIIIMAIWLAPGRKRGPAAPLGLCLSLSLLPLLSILPGTSYAFEIRRDEQRITIPAGETIDDTLVLMAETILVEGNVTGDLVALGERVTVRGRIGGTLVGMAEVLDVEGEIAGNVLGMAESLDIRGASVGGNVYGMGRTVTVATDTRIAGNAAVAASEADVRGRISLDVLALARSFSLSGSTDGNLRAYAGTIDVTESGRVGGDLIARVREPDSLRVASPAVIAGETRLDVSPEQPSRYVTPGYYLWKALQFVAAFLTGLALFYLFPALRSQQINTGGELLTTAAFGALTLIAVPALAVAAIFTLIGAPLGLLTLAAWLAGLYVAGILTASLIGRRVLQSNSHRPALTLLAGLAILFVLVNVPFLGGIVRLLAILLGLGLIVLSLKGRWGSPAAH